jgi:sialic acid synthase SpsE
VFAIKDIKCGEEFSIFNTAVIRPSDGIKPKYYEQLIGKKANRNIEAGTPILMEDL